MTLIERQKTCLGNVPQKRDSFNERICDDLCEVILQYLSLKDKLRLECVSKQFQRTVFQKQFRLEMLHVRKSKYDIKTLENSVFKKCQNLRVIISFPFPRNNYNELIALVIKYCNHLLEIDVPLSEINDNTFQEFQQKFGPKLKFYNFGSILHIEGFTNLEELSIYECEAQVLIDSGVELMRLKRLQIYSIENKNIKNIIDWFKTVRHLTLDYSYEKVANQVFTCTTNLRELVYLRTTEKINLRDQSVFNHLKQMSDNCPKLKSIHLRIVINFKNFGSDLRRLLSAFKAFKQLKRMYLILKTEEEDNPEMLSFDAFKGLSNITHFTFELEHVYNSIHLDQTFLAIIANNLPNLQKLCVSTLKITPEGSTEVADILSRLSKLETFELEVTDKKIAKQLTQELAEKCKRIRKIVVIQNPEHSDPFDSMKYCI